jgi:small basic protein (TIGR04137 family)
MSIHKSLVAGERLRRQRNVLTRWERIMKLKEEERWPEKRSVFGLPKVRVVHAKKHKKAKKEVVEGEEGAVPAEGAPAATPAAGAAKATAKPAAAPAKAAAPAAKKTAK